jgi:prevent-host-death family protein
MPNCIPTVYSKVEPASTKSVKEASNPIAEHEVEHTSLPRQRTSLNSFLKEAILAGMKKISITDAKNNLSALIDGLKGGSPVLIMDRGRPVARLEPVTTGRGPDPEGRLARLVREGVVRPGRTALPKSLFAGQPPRSKSGVSGVEVLIRERREGR